MIIDVKVSSPGESITQVVLSSWLVADGSRVEKDQEIAEIDSDKATLTLYAPEAGILKWIVQEGDTLGVGAVACTIDTEGKIMETKSSIPLEIMKDEERSLKPRADNLIPESPVHLHISPLAQKILDSKGLSNSQFLDMLNTLRFNKNNVEEVIQLSNGLSVPKMKHENPTKEEPVNIKYQDTRSSDRKKMSPLRMKLSERLVAVKNETAMLTTFNEINMQSLIDLRNSNKVTFKEKHGVALSYVSFFAKAVAIALHDFPSINSMIDGDDMVFYKYVDLSIAVSTPKGLMAPVVRNVEKMSIPEIEKEISRLATKAREGKISLEEMSGGTFTISNGGVFGSLMSTPIINPPQSAILGMHNIVDRPVAEKGQVVIRPMMYVALSYDHRVVDGKESVGFLLRIKELIENPIRILTQGEDLGNLLLGF